MSLEMGLAMGLAFCFISGCPGSGFSLISLSLIVRFVFHSFSNFLISLSFSVWSVVVVVFSMCRIVRLRSRSQSIPSTGFISSRSVISIGKLFLIHPLSASTVIIPVSLNSFFQTSWYFLVNGNVFLSFDVSLFRGNIVTVDPVSTMKASSVPLFFYCHGKVISSVSYVFNFVYFIYRLVAIVFLSHFGFRILFNFLSFLLFRFACFREVSFLFTFKASGLLGRTFMVRIPIGCVTISTTSVTWSLFRSCSVFSGLWYSVYRFIFDVFVSV